MSDKKVTCDDCGTLNVATLQRCELCGESLHEEHERKKQGSLPLLLFAALGLTGLCFILPGAGLFMYLTGMREIDISPGLFGLLYSVTWVVLALLSNHYAPKSHYYFGWDMGHGGFINNPFTLQDDADRAHASLGMLLFPVHILVGVWRAVWLRSKV